MSDYSLQSAHSRPARVDDKLVIRDFGTGARGFAVADNLELTVCVILLLPGQLRAPRRAATYHDALEFPDGRTVMLTHLYEA